MNTEAIAKAVRTFTAPSLAREYGRKNAKITVTAQAYKLGGNQHPHFSVTADLYNPRWPENPFACGCLHEEAARFWPKIKPIIALHLSNADDGEPMHAEANGYYWLAGAVGGLGEQYHGGSGSSAKSPDECLRILADHLRISLDDAKHIADACEIAYNSGFKSPIQPTMAHLRAGASASDDPPKAASTAARNVFKTYVISQRGRWAAEARAGLALIQSLAAQESAQ